MPSLEPAILALAPKGLQINLWPVAAGYQANVREHGAPGWTCVTKADPLAALDEALRQRVGPSPVSREESQQIDLEDYIADADPFGGLLE